MESRIQQCFGLQLYGGSLIYWLLSCNKASFHKISDGPLENLYGGGGGGGGRWGEVKKYICIRAREN